MYKNHIFQVTTKHLHLDLFVDFQQKVSKVLHLPYTHKKFFLWSKVRKSAQISSTPWGLFPLDDPDYRALKIPFGDTNNFDSSRMIYF